MLAAAAADGLDDPGIHAGQLAAAATTSAAGSSTKSFTSPTTSP